MNARRAARELAIISFSQIEKDLEKWQSKDIEDIILLSARTLVHEAQNNLKKTVGALFSIKEYIETYEAEHPKNLERPIDVSNIPVAIPMTSDMVGRIDSLIDSADVTFNAIEVTELFALANKKVVKDYIVELIELYRKNKEDVDKQINSLAKGWNIDRLIRIDRDILRLAIIELLYVTDVPISVAIDEAVEMAKKYSEEESSAFINGILREVVETNKLYQLKK